MPVLVRTYNFFVVSFFVVVAVLGTRSSAFSSSSNLCSLNTMTMSLSSSALFVDLTNNNVGHPNPIPITTTTGDTSSLFNSSSAAAATAKAGSTWTQSTPSSRNKVINKMAAASSSTRSRAAATKRPPLLFRNAAPRQRAGSTDSLDNGTTSTSILSTASNALELDEMDIFDTTAENHHNSNSSNNDKEGIVTTSTLLTHKSSVHSSSAHSGVSDMIDIEATSQHQPIYMHRGTSTSNGSLLTMEIRASPTNASVCSDEDNRSRKDVSWRNSRTWPSAAIGLPSLSSVVSTLENPSLQTGRLIVLSASAIYGTNFATVKLLDDAMPLSMSAALRFSLAAGVVSAFVLGRENDDVDGMVEKERNLAFWSGAEIGLWYSIGYLAQAEGLQTVAAGKSAFFNALAVVVVPMLDVLVKGKILQKKEIASVALACFGVGLLEIGPEGLTVKMGDILAFMQTIFFGIGYWRLEAVSHAHPHQAARVTVGQLSAVAAGACLYALTEFGLGHVDVSFDLVAEWLGDRFIMGALLWTGLISTALALYLETVALKVVSAAELTLLMTTTSLWGASFAYFTIGEVLSTTGMVGGLMILAGCGLSATAPAPTKGKTDFDSTDKVSTV